MSSTSFTARVPVTLRLNPTNAQRSNAPLSLPQSEVSDEPGVRAACYQSANTIATRRRWHFAKTRDVGDCGNLCARVCGLDVARGCRWLSLLHGSRPGACRYANGGTQSLANAIEE